MVLDDKVLNYLSYRRQGLKKSIFYTYNYFKIAFQTNIKNFVGLYRYPFGKARLC